MEVCHHLGFHLGGLFWVNSQHVLVMTNGMQAIFVLSTDVTTKSLKNAMWPRWVRLQGSQVIFQSYASAVIQHGFYSGQMGFHKLLLLTGCFFL